jgi:hypothetical protein
MNGDYVIVGDTARYEGCLVCVAGSTFEDAKRLLNRMLNNPTENDKKLMSGHTNFRVEFAKESDCWWHGNCD